MAQQIEYAKKIILSLDEVRQTQSAQQEIWKNGFDEPNESQLTDALSAFTSFLSIVFLKWPAASLASGVISLVTGMMTTQKEIVEGLVKEGYWQLGFIETFMANNPQYDLVEVNLPFIEFPDYGVRFISGEGVITRVHSGSGWIIM